MSDLRHGMVIALYTVFEELEKGLSELNRAVRQSVPTPPAFTPPRPKCIAPNWIVGIRVFRARASQYEPSWTRLQRDADRSDTDEHVPQVTLYGMSVIHAHPHLPHPSKWQDLIQRRLEWNAVERSYMPTNTDLELICFSLGWYPHRVEAAISRIGELKQWCYRMVGHIEEWCASQLEQPRAQHAVALIDDILVEQALTQGGSV